MFFDDMRPFGVFSKVFEKDVKILTVLSKIYQKCNILQCHSNPAGMSKLFQVIEVFQRMLVYGLFGQISAKNEIKNRQFLNFLVQSGQKAGRNF